MSAKRLEGSRRVSQWRRPFGWRRDVECGHVGSTSGFLAWVGAGGVRDHVGVVSRVVGSAPVRLEVLVVRERAKTTTRKGVEGTLSQPRGGVPWF